MTAMLQDGLTANAVRAPDAQALVAPDACATYGELDALANRIARTLMERGVKLGDRLGIWFEKSTVSVACMHAALRLGSAYVPVDPLMPVDRANAILSDCGMAMVVTSSSRIAALSDAGYVFQDALCVDTADWQLVLEQSSEPLSEPERDQDRLAYILYTSGSTGTPKGVCISHRNALAFVDWAVATAGLTPQDRLSNHASFHFDLSVLDLYGAFAVGACVVLLPDTYSFNPVKLVDVLVEEQISVWYSVPSVLILMMEKGGLLERHELKEVSLRLIFFAGEPFPIQKLRPLCGALAKVRFLNLYGPTETNVCTAYEVYEIPSDQLSPVPIGGAASGDKVWAQTAEDKHAEIGEEGELIVDGPTVMLGYWGHEPQGARPYATGDIVRRIAEDCYDYIGRRDAMLKVRGFRIEAGDIEAALLDHLAIADCAVTTRGSGLDAKLVACLVLKDDAKRPGLLSIKSHIAARLPRYMIVDSLCILDALPRNRNGKTDRRQIAELATKLYQEK
jgi:amino acid adenylation domain-containing protein